MKLFGRLLSFLLVAAVAAFLLAPGWAFFGVRAAADANDLNALGKLVDYGAVRASLRPQLSGQVADLTPPPSILEDPIGAVRHQIEVATRGQTSGPDVETYLTAPALAALTRGEGRDANQARSVSAGGPAPANPWPAITFYSLTSTQLQIKDDAGRPTIFTFERRGVFDWKLTHVGLPDLMGPARPVEGTSE